MARPNTIVFKIGGEILRNPKMLKQAVQEIIAIKKRGPKANIVLVHGAGPQLDQRFAEAGLKVEKIGGKRVSTQGGLNVAWKFIPDESKRLVSMLDGPGLRAESIDYNLTTLARIGDRRLGLVGTPIGADVNNLKRVLRKGAIPIVAIFGVTKQKQIVNVNADEVAAGIATALKADMLVLKTNTPGVVRAGKTVGRITPSMANRLVKGGIASGGMDVKLRAAATAVECGVPYARISGVGPNNKGTTIRRRR